MNITVANSEGNHVAGFVLDANATVAALKELVTAQMKIQNPQLYLHGGLLQSEQKLVDQGVSNHEILEVRTSAPPRAAAPSASAPAPASNTSINTPAGLQAYLRANPQMLQQLRFADPELAEAASDANLARLTALLARRQHAIQEQKMQEQRRIALLNADPFDIEAQRKIEEEVHASNVRENMEMAMEFHPESFTQVTMLYVPMEVNGVQVNALIDSGAQMTVMSKECADRCGISRLIDKQWGGMAVGVGSAPIVGRVHLAKVKMGPHFLNCSFTILAQSNGVDFLFGLDQLRKHQALIDLRRNCLVIGEHDIPFMHEKDIPKREHPASSSSSSSSSSASLESKSVHTSPPTQASTSTSTTPAQPLITQPSSSSSAPPAPASISAPAGPGAAGAGAGNHEAAIAQLMALGYPRLRVIEALTVTEGNMELAAAYLLEN